MNILVLNPGSASLKFEIIDADPSSTALVRAKLLSGSVEVIGKDAKLYINRGRERVEAGKMPVQDHGEASGRVLAWINGGNASAHGIRSLKDIEAAGHRVVHGGEYYAEPVEIDDDVLRTIESLEDLAPLHNRPALSVIRATRAALGRNVHLIAVFDTAFHRTIPDRARYYAIPWELTERYRIHRYGFHGISHNYLMLRYAELTATPVHQTNIVTLHLEGGSSATAIMHGKSVDTSMGFTPLEGLMMGTRSGDIDPAVIPFLARKEHVDAAEIEELLNRKSGLLGVSGCSEDTRVLVKQPPGDTRTLLALDMFAYRVRKYIGAYLAAMGSATAIVFSGGIGENTPDVRAAICNGLERLGVAFDPERNAVTADQEGRISRDDSPIQALVIPSEEGLMIAHEVLRCLVVSGATQ